SRFYTNPARFNQQVAYMGLPVFHDVQSPNSAVGFLVVEIPSTMLTDIVNTGRHWQALGLGLSGDVYLTDQDGQLLTELRPMLEEPAVFLPQLKTLTDSNQFDTINRLQQTRGIFSPKTQAVTQALEIGRASCRERLRS